MKKFLLILSLTLCTIASFSQDIYDATTLRNRINTEVIPNNQRLITGAIMNKILNGFMNIQPTFSNGFSMTDGYPYRVRLGGPLDQHTILSGFNVYDFSLNNIRNTTLSGKVLTLTYSDSILMTGLQPAAVTIDTARTKIMTINPASGKLGFGYWSQIGGSGSGIDTGTFRSLLSQYHFGVGRRIDVWAGADIYHLDSLALAPEPLASSIFDNAVPGATVTNEYLRTGDNVHGIIDDNTGTEASYTRVTVDALGNPLTDASISPPMLVKRGSEYFIKNTSGPYYDLRWWPGFKADQVTDNTVVFQKALDFIFSDPRYSASRASGYGATLYLGPGRINVSADSLKIYKDNLTLLGDGMNVTEIYTTSPTKAIFSVSNRMGLNMSGFNLKDLTIRTTVPRNGGFYPAIILDQVVRSTWEDCRFIEADYAGSGALQSGIFTWSKNGWYENTINRCQFWGVGAALVLDDGAQADKDAITNCDFLYTKLGAAIGFITQPNEQGGKGINFINISNNKCYYSLGGNYVSTSSDHFYHTTIAQAVAVGDVTVVMDSVTNIAAGFPIFMGAQWNFVTAVNTSTNTVTLQWPMNATRSVGQHVYCGSTGFALGHVNTVNIENYQPEGIDQGAFLNGARRVTYKNITPSNVSRPITTMGDFYQLTISDCFSAAKTPGAPHNQVGWKWIEMSGFTGGTNRVTFNGNPAFSSPYDSSGNIPYLFKSNDGADDWMWFYNARQGEPMEYAPGGITQYRAFWQGDNDSTSIDGAVPFTDHHGRGIVDNLFFTATDDTTAETISIKNRTATRFNSAAINLIANGHNMKLVNDIYQSNLNSHSTQWRFRLVDYNLDTLTGADYDIISHYSQGIQSNMVFREPYGYHFFTGSNSFTLAEGMYLTNKFNVNLNTTLNGYLLLPNVVDSAVATNNLLMVNNSNHNVYSATAAEFNTLLGNAAGVTRVGLVDSLAGVTNGLQIVGQNIYAQSASTTRTGLINTTTQSFAGTKTFTGNLIGTSNIMTNSITPTSNFWAKGAGITQWTDAAHGVNGGLNTNNRVAISGTTATLNASANAFHFEVAQTDFTLPATGVHPYIGGTLFRPPTVTAGAGATVNIGTNVLVDGEPTFTVSGNTYGLYVRAAKTYLDGTTFLSTVANATGDFITRNATTGEITTRTAAQVATDLGVGGAGSYINNSTTQQTSSNFNISGTAVIGTSLGIGTNAVATGGPLMVTASGATGLNLAPDAGTSTNSTRLFFSASGSSYSAYVNAGKFFLNYGATAGSSSGTAGFTMDNTGKVGIGQSTPAYGLDVNQNMRVAPSMTASAGLARAAIFSPTLTATANNDVLAAIDVAPTFVTGSFTGVTLASIRSGGIVPATSGSYALGTGTYQWSNVYSQGGVFNIIRPLTSSGIIFKATDNATVQGTLYNNGHLFLETGTQTDGGYNFQTTTGKFDNLLTLATGTTTIAPLNIPIGTLTTALTNGNIENDGSHVYATLAGARVQLDNSAGSGLGGTGTAGTIAMWTASGTLGNSNLFQSSNHVGINQGTPVASAALTITGFSALNTDQVWIGQDNANVTVGYLTNTGTLNANRFLLSSLTLGTATAGQFDFDGTHTYVGTSTSGVRNTIDVAGGFVILNSFNGSANAVIPQAGSVNILQTASAKTVTLPSATTYANNRIEIVNRGASGNWTFAASVVDLTGATSTTVPVGSSEWISLSGTWTQVR